MGFVLIVTDVLSLGLESKIGMGVYLESHMGWYHTSSTGVYKGTCVMPQGVVGNAEALR